MKVFNFNTYKVASQYIEFQDIDKCVKTQNKKKLRCRKATEKKEGNTSFPNASGIMKKLIGNGNLKFIFNITLIILLRIRSYN